MANDYVTRFRADTSQHDAAIKSSTGYIRNFDKNIKKTQSSLQNMTGSLGRMGFDKLKNSLGALGDILVNNVGGALGKVSVAGAGASSSLLGLSAAASTALPALAAIATAVTAISKTSKFEVNLDNLEAITGLDASGMDFIADSAIRMSSKFGIAAGSIVDSMGLIGGQFPALLEDSKALTEVTEAANVLSKAAGIDVTEAARGITNVLNQMNVAASESGRIINVLAAGSQQGAAEVDYLNTALERSGTAFASANMSYVEAVAAIETVAPKYSSAQVAGSQLESTLLRLSVQANNNFKPAVVGMSQALDNLAAAGLSDVEMMKMVGAQNITMLKTLIQSRDTFDDLKVSLDNTNTAYEQMETRMDNLPSKIQSLKTAWDGLFLTIGQSEIFQDILDGIKKLVSGATTSLGEGGTLHTAVKGLMSIFDSLWNSVKAILGIFEPWYEVCSKIPGPLKIAASVLETLANVLSEVTSVFVFFMNKISSGLGTLWKNMKNIFTNTAVFQWFKNQLMKVVEWWDKIIGWIEEKWKAFKQWIGMEVTKFEASGEMVVEPEKPDDIVIDPITIGGIELSKEAEKELIAGTIDWYQDALKKIDEELKGTIVSEERLVELMAKKAEYAKELEALQLKYGLTTQKSKRDLNGVNTVNPDPNSYQGIVNALAEKNEQLDLQIYGTDEYWRLVEEIRKLTEKKHEISLKMDTDLLTDAEKKIIDVNNAIMRTEQIGEDFSSVFSSLGQIFTQFGQDGEEANNKIAQTMGVVASAISEIIPQIISMITAKQAEAIASGTASAAKVPYPANIAAIFSIVATLGSVFASLQGIYGYANGGIIKGATSIGDYNIAKVNSGEMILNGSQQSKLFNLLNSGNLSTMDGESSNQVEFHLRGEELIGLMNNVNRKKRRIT